MNLLEEHSLTLKHAARHVATMQNGSMTRATIATWIHIGLKHPRTGEQVKLEHVRIGGRIYTSVEAIDRFLAERTVSLY